MIASCSVCWENKWIKLLSIRYKILSGIWHGRRVSLTLYDKNKDIKAQWSPFQSLFTSLKFFVMVSGESHPKIVWPSFSGCSDQMTDQSQCHRKKRRLYLWGESNKALSLCLSLYLPVWLHISCIGFFRLSHLSLCVYLPAYLFPSPLPVFMLDCFRLPGFIFPSVPLQPDLAVVSGLFQSVTVWLTDLWAD